MYRGSARHDLVGNYLFGVWSQRYGSADGAVFIAEVAKEQGIWKHKKLRFQIKPKVEFGHYLLGFGQDDKGEVYLLTTYKNRPKGKTGKIYQIR